MTWTIVQRGSGSGFAVAGVHAIPIGGSGSGLPEGPRVAWSSDGNAHDRDDYTSIAMATALLGAAGYQFVHLQHSSHIWNTFPDREAICQMIAEDTAEDWGMTHPIFNVYSNRQNTYDDLADEINKSTAVNPLTILIGGPMEVVWQAINQSNPSARQYVTVVSHSNWNNTHATSHDPNAHDWVDLPALGVNAIKIDGQNGNLNRPYSEWYWLRDSSDPRLQWLWEVGEIAAKPNYDVSDAGMMYWFLTGDENGEPSDFEAFFAAADPPTSGGSAISEGNLLALFVGARASVVDTPSGWNQTLYEDSDDDVLACYTKIAGAAEPGTVDVATNLTTGRSSWVWYELEGFGAVPIRAVASEPSGGNNTTSRGTGTTSPAFAGDLALAAFISKEAISGQSFSNGFVKDQSAGESDSQTITTALRELASDGAVSSTMTYTPTAETHGGVVVFSQESLGIVSKLLLGTISFGGTTSPTVINQTTILQSKPDATVQAGGWDTGPTPGQPLHQYVSDVDVISWIEATP